LHEITLQESIRYKPGDEIETWLTRVLCLDATDVHHMLTGTPPPKECELYYVNRDTLFSFHKASEAFLTNVMSIYVSAHYKNTPNDLQMLSDAPAHHVFVLLGPVKEENKKVPEVLAVVQVCFEGSLSKNTVKNSFESGRRGTGDLLPWTVSQQFLENNFATLAGARIVRLAVHPDFQQMGYGSRALQLLQQYFQGEFPCLNEKNNITENNKKIRSIHNHETVALLEEQIAPRENLPPLLVRLEERPAERLDYIGVSFGLTLSLLKFWKKSGFLPVYLRQTTNDLTGEHTCIMLKSLNNEDDPELGNWMADFFQEFRQRLINLLGFQFRKFDPQLAMSLMFIRNNPSLTGIREKCKRNVWTPRQLKLVFSNRDVRRLSQYSRNMVDHHLVTDLIPTLASLFFTEKLEESLTLNAIQSAILVAIGLQRKTVDDVASELNMPVNQILAIFLKGIRTLSGYLDESFLNAMEDDLQESHKIVKNVVGNENDVDEKMEKLRSLDDDLKEGEERVKKQQQRDKEELVNELKLDNYAIKGTDDEWKSAVSNIKLTSAKSGIISVKSKGQESVKRPLRTFEPPGPKIKKKKLNKYKNK
jgi:N-acetyltransferase 10